MTDLARRPAGARPGVRPSRARAVAGRLSGGSGPDHEPLALSLPLAALAAAVWAATLGLVIVGVLMLMGWAVAAHSDSTIAQALQGAGLGWLALHRAPVGIASGSLAVLPLGLMLLPLWLTHRAGRWAGRAGRVTELGDAALVVVGGSLVYGLVAAIVAGAATMTAASVVPLHALLAATTVCLVGMGSGVMRATGLWSSLRALVPESVVHVLRAGAAAALAYVAMAATLAGVALLLHIHDAVQVQRALAPGVIGGTLLMLLGLGYLPVAVVWAGAYAAGPGFAVGSGTSYSPFGVTDGALPALPWLAALPDTAPRAGLVLLLLPVLAGAVGGVVLLRRMPEHTTTVLVGEVVGVAVVFGLLWAGAAALAAGGMGPGRLAFAGPSWWQVWLVLTGEALVGLVLVMVADTVRMAFHSRSNAG